MSDKVEELKNKYCPDTLKQGGRYYDITSKALDELSVHYEQRLAEKQSRINRAVEFTNDKLAGWPAEVLIEILTEG